jgi:hypothetical protein
MKSWSKKKSSKITFKNHRKGEISAREQVKKVPQKLVSNPSILQK